MSSNTLNASHLFSSPRLPLGPTGLCPLFQRAVPEAVPVVELPINQVALHQVDVVPADTTAAAADIPTLCQDPFLWERSSGEQAALRPVYSLRISQISI